MHCNEVVDLDGIVRVSGLVFLWLLEAHHSQLSQEFHFPIAAIHSGSDAYLVPEVLQRAYGICALRTLLNYSYHSQVNHLHLPFLQIAGKWTYTTYFILLTGRKRKRREQYRASEFAPRILAERNFTVLIQVKVGFVLRVEDLMSFRAAFHKEYMDDIYYTKHKKPFFMVYHQIWR